MNSLKTARFVTAAVVPEERLSYLRRRNKVLILLFFSLIIVLALIIGGIILHLVRDHNSRAQTLLPNLAIRKFCSPSSPFSCITALRSAVKPPTDANPARIFAITLESCVRLLSAAISLASDGVQPTPAVRRCSSSLGHALGQLNNIAGTMRFYSDQIYQRRDGFVAWIDVAVADLAECDGDLEVGESTAVDEAMVKVHQVGTLLRYSRNFLIHFETVHESFLFALTAEDERWMNRTVENLFEVSIFGSQYFVLVILFLLFMRI